ncbi:hypothetical protein LOTGIDRAFT_153783 [Lottia gigantea]|uniref:Ig-like domain-containing protein n=1 Tax=Lottia gigantea TaxID=225164 RepID=V3ZJB4_LOTGI|nr:hypothetical protein LOTGIDRAFT_153783 [Lottia gigantea]ESO91348.1 hypothetical protein LOTGIDRAFT_153783 [Lottia gigantea]
MYINLHRNYVSRLFTSKHYIVVRHGIGIMLQRNFVHNFLRVLFGITLLNMVKCNADVSPLELSITRLENNITAQYSVVFTYSDVGRVQLIWYEADIAKKDDHQTLDPEGSNGTSLFTTNSTETVKLEVVLHNYLRIYYFHHHDVTNTTTFCIPSKQVTAEPSDLRYRFGSILPGNLLIHPSKDPDFEMEINWSLLTVDYSQEQPAIQVYHQWKMKRTFNPPIVYIDKRIENNTTNILYALSTDQQRLDGTLIWSVLFASTNHGVPLDHIVYKLTLPVLERIYTEPYDENVLGFVNQHQSKYPDCLDMESCVITCEVVGFYPSDITLYRNDNFTNFQNVTLFSKIVRHHEYGILAHFTIPLMTQEHEGLYRCEARNTVGVSTSIGIELFSRKPVNILHDESSLVDFEDGEVYGFTLTCLARGHPAPTMSFRKNDPHGQTISNGTSYTVVTSFEDEIHSIVLTIRQVDYSVFSYVCVAVNQFNRDYYSFYP